MWDEFLGGLDKAVEGCIELQTNLNYFWEVKILIPLLVDLIKGIKEVI